MSHHAAYSLSIEFLDIVLIEDSRPMQMILRSMLTSLRARRIRIFDDGARAFAAMIREPPNLVITDWRMPGMSGLQFLKTLRDVDMAPLCFVPVLVVTAHATQSVVENSMRYGAHTLLVKPVAPATLLERIHWIVNDKRHFVIGEGRSYVIEGTREKLETQRERANALKSVRENQDRHLAAARDHTDEPQLAKLRSVKDKPASAPAALPPAARPRAEEPLPLASTRVAQPRRRVGSKRGWGEVVE